MKLTREQVLKNLEEIVRFGGLAMSSEFVESVRTAMEAYENQREWIPVGEWLPKEGRNVLITVNEDVREASYYKHGNGWCDNDGFLFAKAEEATAWMPLPEPYKAESEDNEC